MTSSQWISTARLNPRKAAIQHARRAVAKRKGRKNGFTAKNRNAKTRPLSLPVGDVAGLVKFEDERIGAEFDVDSGGWRLGVRKGDLANSR